MCKVWNVICCLEYGVQEAIGYLYDLFALDDDDFNEQLSFLPVWEFRSGIEASFRRMLAKGMLLRRFLSGK